MRAYFWTNFMLSSIQHGIQAQHCTAEMFTKYYPGTENFKSIRARELLFDWSTNHKTTIIKNGGTLKDLWKIIVMFDEQDNYLPYDYFREDQDSLGGIVTCVGIIVPEKIYNITKDEYEFGPQGWNDFDHKLYNLINSTSLAR